MNVVFYHIIYIVIKRTNNDDNDHNNRNNDVNHNKTNNDDDIAHSDENDKIIAMPSIIDDWYFDFAVISEGMCENVLGFVIQKRGCCNQPH